MDSRPAERTLSPENQRHRDNQRLKPLAYWAQIRTPQGPRPVRHEHPNRHQRRAARVQALRDLAAAKAKEPKP